MEGRQFEFSLKLGMNLAKEVTSEKQKTWVKTEEEYALLVATGKKSVNMKSRRKFGMVLDSINSIN